MPSTMSVQLVLVWFAVGFCTGLGWSVAVWLVSKILR